MKNKLKIAIYSGDIPSTTFIERLIHGVSNAHTSVYLFGFIKEKVNYKKQVSVFAYKNTKLHKGLHLIKYSFLLFCFKHKEKRKLDAILKQQSKNLLLDKVKCYPILWHKPDIFHLQWAKGLADWIWVQEFGIKLVLSLRGAHINYSPIADLQLASMYLENFPKVEAFHAVSKAIGLEAEKYKASREKIKVVYSGFDGASEMSSIKKAKSPFQIISIGRPHWIKGYTYALDACKILKDNNFEFEYTIIGGANDIELVYQVHDLTLDKEVTLLDQMPFAKVQEMLQNSNLLLLPSIKEGVANVVLEAMALKTMVLSTDCGGVTEVVNEGVNGFIVPIRNARRMAEKIMEIANLSENEEIEIIEQATKTIKENHSEKQMVTEMLALYKSI